MDQPTRRLITGGTVDQFLPHLLASIEHASRIDIAVAFVKSTGLRLIFDELSLALHRSPAARVRFLTSDYLDVTDPEALTDLLTLCDHGLEARLFDASQAGFHLKAYLFASARDRGEREWAYVGSSNISRSALTETLEWNYRVERADSPAAITEIREAFDALWQHRASRPITDDVVSGYRARRRVPVTPVAPGSADSEEGPPLPNTVQELALASLRRTREDGFSRALVVMATGLGKTYLAAFDARAAGAQTVLFLAHREEILAQAQRTFTRLFPHASAGLYTGSDRARHARLLFASVQTLSRSAHLESFGETHFDYIVVDEFHHAQAPTYRRVIARFKPRFLLGLTATPDRTDGADIRALCDENEVFTFHLFEAVAQAYLCPFTYYGIIDSTVDYREIPWRNGTFDPDTLETKLATITRADHAWREWSARRQARTLAFCVSQRHADFMAARFRDKGHRAVAVHGASETGRAQALAMLERGEIDVIFSVDLFSEGVDLPAIDTILMLRPTESRILFLQQLGRGLRHADGKERLVILDFIGNHKSFLAKPQALLGLEPTTAATRRLIADYERGDLRLPPGCFVNFDLGVIDFLRTLHTGAVRAEYETLRDALGRRPSAVEFYRSGASLQRTRAQHGSWFDLVNETGDLTEAQAQAFAAHRDLLKDVETTTMTRVFKMVALEAFLELDGFTTAPTTNELSAASLELFRRRRNLVPDLADALRDVDRVTPQAFLRYWEQNPINAWTGGNLASPARVPFELTDGRFRYRSAVSPAHAEALGALVRELIDLRIAQYADRSGSPVTDAALAAESTPAYEAAKPLPVPYFPNIPIACGHFRAGSPAPDELYTVSGTGLHPRRAYFVARASGDSMSGGDRPVHDGDALLLEYLAGSDAPSAGEIVVIEQPTGPEAAPAQTTEPAAGADRRASYLLRRLERRPDGTISLVATNPAYPPLALALPMRPVARLLRRVDPLESHIGSSFLREEIPPLFGAEYNPGNWNAGHVSLPAAKAIVLLVTLNKQGKAVEHRYVDRWEDEHTFVWQSQRSTTPESKKGREITDHEANGVAVHLFVRDRKLGADGTAARFVYRGRVRYLGHEGSAPMTVRLGLT